MLEEGEKPVTGPEPGQGRVGVAEAAERGLLGGEVGFQVLMGDGRAGMTQPECDHGEVRARLQEVDCRRVSNRVR